MQRIIDRLLDRLAAAVLAILACALFGALGFFVYPEGGGWSMAIGWLVMLALIQFTLRGGLERL